uniref:Peptidase_M13 domain-containing protein n=1 Tax=Caenorhabditis japonica TaxID=281687 RepID=A0A8R1DWX2_CAEJA
MRLVLLFTFFLSANGFDFIVENLKKYVNHDADPCDDFYRHACPLDVGIPRDLVFLGFQDILAKNSLKNPRAWDKFSVKKDIFERPRNETFNDKIEELYLHLCENEGNTTLMLKHLEPILFNPAECRGRFCLAYIRDDPNCKRAAKHLNSKLSRDMALYLSESLIEYHNQFFEFVTFIQILNAILDIDVRDGIHLVEEYLEDMKKIAIEWVQKTPWAINNEVSKSIKSLIEQIYLFDNYGENLRNSIDLFIKIEKAYTDCKAQYNDSKKAVELCFLIVSQDPKLKIDVETLSFSDANAYYGLPSIYMGFAYYYVAQFTEAVSAKIGFSGGCVGHEFGHGLIKSTSADDLTYFSNNSRNCIQNQYNSTCKEFVEQSCDTYDKQVDENGADIIGLQLAYELLERHCKDDLKTIYKPLNVTHQQLFFYATAVSYCQGKRSHTITRMDGTLDSHASANIRVNAMISQHPGFKDAFQCSKESRMIKSAVDQCIIYGEHAPQTRKH